MRWITALFGSLLLVGGTLISSAAEAGRLEWTVRYQGRNIRVRHHAEQSGTVAARDYSAWRKRSRARLHVLADGAGTSRPGRRRSSRALL